MCLCERDGIGKDRKKGRMEWDRDACSMCDEMQRGESESKRKIKIEREGMGKEIERERDPEKKIEIEGGQRERERERESCPVLTRTSPRQCHNSIDDLVSLDALQQQHNLELNQRII